MKPNTINALILDMDGVLWRDKQSIGSLPKVFKTMQDYGLKVTLATNNASLSVEQYLDKISNFQVALRPEQIVTSAEATAHYLRNRFPDGGRVYVVGGTGLAATMEKYGFEIADHSVDAVIVSFDRQLEYQKLKTATLLVRAGVPLIATNPDRTYPTPDGLIPGAGAILAAVVAATDATPVIIGKPEPVMYWVAMERMGTTPGTTLVVGDRLETDIAGGQKIGCPTALVLSGVTDSRAAQSWTPPPDWIEPDLTTVLEKLGEHHPKA